VPATAAAAKGLLSAAIRDPGPVLFLEPVRLYAGAAAPLPPGEYQLALGEARLARPAGTSRWWRGGRGGGGPGGCRGGRRFGVSLEVLDLQALAPLDAPALLASVGRTGRLVVVEGEPGGDGWGRGHRPRGR